MSTTVQGLTVDLRKRRPSLRAHLEIMRADHWAKNVFVLPGLVVALSLDPARMPLLEWWTVIAGLISVCLITSSNYVINELLDGPFDSMHPIKCMRPVPSNRVHIPVAYAQWLFLFALGLGFAWQVSRSFTVVMIVLWIMGCLYNLPPVRTKDVTYLDVVSEAVNNPLRMLAGWYMVGTSILPPSSLLVSYWMVGCYFMAIKRFAEYREIADPARSAAYRRSFAFYSEQKLLVSIMFYGTTAMLFFGAFIMRYRLELILSFPLVAVVMAVYLSISFKKDSAAQRPEGLYRERNLMASVVSCAAVMMLLLFVDVPILHQIFIDYPSSRMPQ